MNTKTITKLPLHITPHHLRLSPALRDFVRTKLAKVPRIAGDATAADVILRRHHGTANGKRFSASARLALPGRDIHATAGHADIYTAIVSLVSKLERHARKRKTRMAKSKTRLRSSSLTNAASARSRGPYASRLGNSGRHLTDAGEVMRSEKSPRQHRREAPEELRAFVGLKPFNTHRSALLPFSRVGLPSTATLVEAPGDWNAVRR